jgi:hypothetical protein
MQEGVREYIESVEMGTFRRTTDNVVIHGKSPEVTRKLIHLIVKTGDNLKQEQFALQLI